MSKSPFYLLILPLFFFFAFPAQAVCPVCTVAVGACVGLSRWLGIDDIITGLWLGGLLASTTIWTVSWLRKKQRCFPGCPLVTSGLYYGSTILVLCWQGLLGYPLNKLWGIDKLLLGLILGSALFLAGAGAYFYLKKRNQDKAYFPFQKVVMPIVPLVILSLIFYFLTK